MIPKYGKILNMGHANLGDHLKTGTLYVQEKLDGSQLSWGWIDGKLHVRSKGKVQFAGDEFVETDKMFLPAVEHLTTIKYDPTYDGVVFRGEYFTGPKHNTLRYDSIPLNGIALFDVEIGGEPITTNQGLMKWGGWMKVGWLPFSIIPAQFVTLDSIDKFLAGESILGGPKPEGVVIKKYGTFHDGGPFDGYTVMAKYVSEEFKEVHHKDWKGRNPGQKDLVLSLQEQLNTEARFQKAVQHLRERGELEGSPRDIGPLMKEVQGDVWEEEREWIEREILRVFVPKVKKGLGKGLPQWYKRKLLEESFGEEE